MSKLTSSSTWKALAKEAEQLKGQSIYSLFENDPERAQRFSINAAGLFLDYSKNFLNNQALTLLCQLAEETGLKDRIQDLFTGKPVNFTEQRPALHTALRDPTNQPLSVNQVDIKPAIRKTLNRMGDIVDQLHGSSWETVSGKPITDIIHIGIGGSDLGPSMACYALQDFKKTNINIHFVSNIDAAEIKTILKKLSPEQTLLIISSKSFGTIETLTNAKTAMQWLAQPYPEAIEKQVIAITANEKKAKSFGIPANHILSLWDWVGGRYSIWSAIGLPLMIQIGREGFDEFLAGAYAMDHHLLSAPMDQNMPVLLGLLGIWSINFFNRTNIAVLPYAERLKLLPDYLQQLDMESNGKTINRKGDLVDYATGAVLWGQVGCNGQHAFHQLFHQGSQWVPIDFILPIKTSADQEDHHELMVANCLSQSQALMMGRSLEESEAELRSQGYNEKRASELASHLTISGNRPSNVILMEQVNPRHLGSLITLYEHRVYIQACIWDINPFDQWGVELGKALAGQILHHLYEPSSPFDGDGSTNQLVEKIRS